MEEILQQAKALQNELIEIRRYLHKNAEVGFALDKTQTYIQKQLEDMGIPSQKCGKAGITALLGKSTGKTFLLRADMDALPIPERSGEPFAAKNGNMHACGHDFHATMLLGAAKLLKAQEKTLNGRVKLLFQPAEEILEGAKDVLKSGVLTSPKVDGAMMLHVMTGNSLPVGAAVVASAGVSAPAADYFKITVQGKGCHGSAPWNGVDALTVAARILLGLQELAARELSPSQTAVLTVGGIKTGGAGNAVSDTAELSGTMRAFDEGVRDFLKKRMKAIAENTAKAYRAKAKISYQGGCPTLVNDRGLSEFAYKTMGAVSSLTYFSANLTGDGKERNGGSEDFAYISHEVPSVMIALAAGEEKKGYAYPLHHPKAKFDEGALYMGAAAYAHIAKEWLNS
ncbi:MAG: amidohydrolase [Clostridia bacterium]|nr:amidohydrolase [Clostridia bacterium]